MKQAMEQSLKRRLIRIAYKHEPPPCNEHLCRGCSLYEPVCQHENRSVLLIGGVGLESWAATNAARYIQRHPEDFSAEDITEVLI